MKTIMRICISKDRFALFIRMLTLGFQSRKSSVASLDDIWIPSDVVVMNHHIIYSQRCLFVEDTCAAPFNNHKPMNNIWFVNEWIGYNLPNLLFTDRVIIKIVVFVIKFVSVHLPVCLSGCLFVPPFGHLSVGIMEIYSFLGWSFYGF